MEYNQRSIWTGRGAGGQGLPANVTTTTVLLEPHEYERYVLTTNE